MGYPWRDSGRDGPALIFLFAERVGDGEAEIAVPVFFRIRCVGPWARHTAGVGEVDSNIAQRGVGGGQGGGIGKSYRRR